MLVYANELLALPRSKINCNGQLQSLAATYGSVYYISNTEPGFLPFIHIPLLVVFPYSQGYLT